MADQGDGCGLLTLADSCPAVLCALMLSVGGAAGTAQARHSDQVIAQPAQLSPEKFLPSQQPSCGFGVQGSLSAEHPTC